MMERIRELGVRLHRQLVPSGSRRGFLGAALAGAAGLLMAARERRRPAPSAGACSPGARPARLDALLRERVVPVDRIGPTDDLAG